MTIIGVVSAGQQEGRKLGYPTANLSLVQDSSRAEPGIFAALVSIKNQTPRSGILISGVYEDAPNLPRQEVYILDFQGDLYGQMLEVKVIKKIRDIVRTNNAEELKQLIDNDIVEVKEILR